MPESQYLRRSFGGADPVGDHVAGEWGVSRRLRRVEDERREARRIPDALIRRGRGAMIEVEGLSKSFGAARPRPAGARAAASSVPPAAFYP